jgi:hypothetical protein
MIAIASVICTERRLAASKEQIPLPAAFWWIRAATFVCYP